MDTELNVRNHAPVGRTKKRLFLYFISNLRHKCQGIPTELTLHALRAPLTVGNVNTKSHQSQMFCNHLRKRFSTPCFLMNKTLNERILGHYDNDSCVTRERFWSGYGPEY